MTDLNTGTVYSDIGTGAFTAENGEELLPGWQIFVGFDNYARAFTEESIRGPLVYVTLWTFAFAIISVGGPSSSGSSSRSSSTTRGCADARWYRAGMTPALRLPRLPVRAHLAGHDEPELRLPQPGALRRGVHPVADGSHPGEVLGAPRQPVARVPLHVPDLHWARCSRSPRSSPKPPRSTARNPGRSSGSSSSRCCSSRSRRC